MTLDLSGVLNDLSYNISLLKEDFQVNDISNQILNLSNMINELNTKLVDISNIYTMINQIKQSIPN